MESCQPSDSIDPPSSDLDKPLTGGRSETARSSPLLAAAATSTLQLTACGGGDSSSSSGPSTAGTVGPTSSPAITVASAARFLLQASISASTDAIKKITQIGFERWLDSEMEHPNDQSAREFYSSRKFDIVDENNHFQRTRTADYMIWSQLMSGGNGVRKRVALALSEFFVVNVEDLDINWRNLAIGVHWDMLNTHAFGSFRKLLEAVTLSPVMATYLDVVGSQKFNAQTNRSPDENFAREVMQLFSIGLTELNIDGSKKLQAGEIIETYTNEDVIGLARCFAGYHYDYSRTEIISVNASGLKIPSADFLYQNITSDPEKWGFRAVGPSYSLEEKSFLRTTIPAGVGPAETLSIALDTLFNHANVGPFFCKQMIQRLVTSNPSHQYVERVANVFNDNGKGMRGDLKAVFKAILLDEEARSDASLTDPRFGKLREPILRLAQFGRTFGAQSLSGDWTIDRLDRDYDQLGQSPLRSPSVFNFFRPNFVATGTNAERNQMVAPEFELANETSVAGFVNFMQGVIEDRNYATRDVKFSFTVETKLAHDAAALVDHLDLLLTAQQLSSANRSSIITAVESVQIPASNDASARLSRVRIAMLLIIASQDYLIQR